MLDIRVTGRMVNFSRLTFETNDLDRIRQNLTEICAANDYTGTLVILNSTVPQELINLIQLLIEFKLQPMAVIDGVLGDEARAIQFPVLPPDQPIQRIQPTSVVHQNTSPSASQTHDVTASNTSQPSTTNSQTSAAVEQTITPSHIVAHNTVYHDEILRTGQSLVEENGDIILSNSMNSGSEIIASGNIFVYGVARGRLIAGASGETSARIFCQSLEAGLISIAGTYCVADDIPQDCLGRTVQIQLNNNQELEFIPISI